MEKPESLRQIEKKAIMATMEYYNGNKSQAAISLGVCLKTVYLKLERHRLPTDFGRRFNEKLR